MKLDPGYYFFVLTFLRRVQTLVDFLLYLTIGYRTRSGWETKRRRSEKEYEFSAQVVNIWSRGAFSVACAHQPENFLYVHDRYVHPRFVLELDHATLHGCTPTHAFFCVTDPSVDVCDVTKYPFMFIYQFLLSQQLVILPHWALNRLTTEEESLNESKRDVVAIYMTGRSGSTLLCQMFKRLPRTLVLAECWALCNAHEWFNKGSFGSREEYEMLVRSLVRVLLKPWKKVTHDRVAIKLVIMNLSQFEIIRKVCPNIKSVFNTRHPKDSMISYCKFFQGGIFGLFEKYQRKDFMYWNMPFAYDQPEMQRLRKELFEVRQELSNEEDNACLYGAALQCFLSNKKAFDLCVVYEEMLENPVEVSRRMFRALRVPEELVPLALTALENHSQNKIFGDTARDRYSKGIDAGGWSRTERMFQRLGLPISCYMKLGDFLKQLG